MARVLCLHGLGGTGATMWPIVGHLASAHHDAFAPTLPGHGSSSDDLVDVGFAAWLDAARDWPADVVVGQSMGAALALALAAEGRVRGVVAINPLAPDPDAVDGLEWRRSRGHERIEVGPSSVGEIAYEELPLGALLAMHHGLLELDLTTVRVPLLVATSANDDVVDPASSDVIAAAVDGPVERLALPRSGHVASLDVDRDLLGRAIVDFVARMMRR
ncbi:MAG: alpha/beta fold hydrolase [Acidimicrobiales bacterium]|nr:alpha/beta fold hydrolase [Acidimicrobiales bacterium]